jgi:hypothetical protein
MAAVRKKTYFLRSSLMSVVSAATLASGATAMPAAETSLYAAPMQATAEAAEPQTEAKTSILTEQQEPRVTEIDTDPKVAVTSSENTAALPATQAASSPDQGDSTVLEPFNSPDSESNAIASVTSVSQLSEVQPTDWTFQTQLHELRVAEFDTNSKVAVTPSENMAAPTDTQTASSPDTDDSRVLELFNSSDLESDAFAQVTSVSQLSDVQPTDWAFQALQNLVERYGCLAGYPDRTYRGNRTLTRYEFAVGLNACLEQIQQLITTSTSNNLVTKEDLATLQRLQDEFAAQLVTLRSRTDTLEARATKLEAHQFTTTTRLIGNIRFQANAFFSGEGDPQANLQYNIFLGLLTSFTGKDLLITALASTNTTLPELVTNNAGRDVGSTPEGTSDTASSGATDNDFRMITLAYQFPVGDKIIVNLIPFDRYRFNPILLPRFFPYYSVGAGPVSAFAEAPPIYFLGAGSGISVSYEMFKATVLSLTYLATFGSDSTPGSGLFNGDYIVGAQINYNPSPKFFLQALYHHGYFGTRRLGDIEVGNFAFNSAQFFRGNGFVGSALANRFDDAGVFFNEASAVSSNAYQIGGYYAISPKVIVGGWVNLINARLLGKGDANIWTYSVQAAFPDLFKEGNVGGLVVGMEPTLTGLKNGNNFVGGFKKDTSLHIEAYYKYQLMDNISITPSVIWITAPNQDADNEDLVIGGIRTTFNF